MNITRVTLHDGYTSDAWMGKTGNFNLNAAVAETICQKSPAGVFSPYDPLTIYKTPYEILNYIHKFENNTRILLLDVKDPNVFYVTHVAEGE